MSGRPFDRIMLAQRVCQSRTSRRLDDGEFRAFIAALCLAGASPVRGALMLSETEALTAHDVADEAGVAEEVAERALVQLEQLGTLVRDEQRDCLRFVHWDRFNPAPRPSETREAWTERKRRQRARQKQEKARAERPSPSGQGLAAPRGRRSSSPARSGLRLPTRPTSNRERDKKRYSDELDEVMQAAFPEAAGRRPVARQPYRSAIERARDAGVETAEELRDYVARTSPDLLEAA